MTESLHRVDVRTPEAWSAWLQHHHDRKTEVWLVFYKKASGEPSIDYESAVEEALCYGWIDGIMKSIDERSYMRRFTPRKDQSNWSPSNKRRVARLLEADRMLPAGLAKVEAAKRSGRWDAPDRPAVPVTMPPAFEAALNDHPAARAHFDALTPGYRRQFVTWVAVAKRPETVAKRIRTSVELLEKGQRLGMV